MGPKQIKTGSQLLGESLEGVGNGNGAVYVHVCHLAGKTGMRLTDYCPIRL